MKKKIFGILFISMLAVSLLMVPAAVATDGEADTVYLNGNIYTVDDTFSTASAMAIKGDRFIYVGSNAGVQEYIGPGTAVIDLNGKTVVPGLMDSHIHFSGVGTKLFSRDVDCYWLPLDELQAAIANAIATGVGLRPGPEPRWFRGSGYNDAIWDPPVAHKELLDVVSPNNPVYISRYCGHAGLANSKAMEIAGITDETPDPAKGHIVRDAEGHATGVFLERATRLITQHIPSWPPLTEEERRHCLVLGSQAVLAAGLTVVHDASGAGMSTVDRRSALYEEGLLKVRINNMLGSSTAESLGAPQIRYDNHYFLNSVKVSADGSLGGRGAALIEEYSDAPGYFGELKIDEDSFALQVAERLDLGFSTRTHCIGDLANRVALNAYERALEETGIAPEDARLCIEHTQILNVDDLPRLAPLGIVASMQEVHCTEDMLFAEDRLGPVRILGGYAWSSLLDTGVVIAGGSDYGVSPYNPFYGLHAAVTRQDRNNQPPGGWYPQECMTREEALRARTMGGAYVMFAEDILGSIEAGKLADFVVIDRDYMTCPAEDIWRIKVLMTVVGGEVVYTAMAVDIDIKPGSYPNSINLKSRGVEPVAVLTTDDFDASTVDPETVAFAGAGAVRWTLEDVDGDGDLDMLFHFTTQKLELTETSTVATLTGTTYAGEVFQGTDTVNIVPTKD